MDVAFIIHCLRNERFSRFGKKNNKLWSYFEEATLKALEDCADEVTNDSPATISIISDSSSDTVITIGDTCASAATTQSNPPSILHFNNEPVDLAVVLDYILVDWPCSLDQMISTRSGRALLRAYSDQALAYLRVALSHADCNDDFRAAIRTLWLNRAVLYFDGRDNTLYPFIPYLFTSDNMTPHLSGDLVNSEFAARIYQDFNERNPTVPLSDANTILNIHVANRVDENDIFYRLGTYGMSSAAYYIENHINQFYRVLFFFVELRAAGISTNEQDVYEGPLPNAVMPAGLQRMIRVDQDYQNYLTSRRNIEVTIANDRQDPILQSLAGTATVHEEDLISLVNPHTVIEFISQAKTTTTTTSSTTPGSRTTKNPSDESGSFNGNGKHCTDYHGESESKRRKYSSSLNYENFFSFDFKDSCLRHSYFVTSSMDDDDNRGCSSEKYYGYVLQDSGNLFDEVPSTLSLTTFLEEINAPCFGNNL